MKKIVPVIIFCLMLTGFAQIVHGWGATQWVPMSSELPAGWMIIKAGWDDYKIIDLNNAPYGTELEVLYLDNLPTGWVSLGSDGWNGYNIKCFIHDYTAPTVPSNLLYSVTDSSVSLSWQASTDLVGVTGYNIYQNNIKIGSTTETSYTITGLAPNTGYNFAVTATDAENESTANVVSVTTNYDYTPPTIPTNFICAEKYDTSLKLSWSAATDNAAVAGYYIYKDGVKIGSTNKLSYAVSNLEHNSTYVFSIQAYDAAGNTSSSGYLTVLMDSNLTVVPYCAGTYDDGGKGACYWQGSTRVDLAGDGRNTAYARSICVNGDTVYTAGYYYKSDSYGITTIPCYWKGITRVDLPTIEGYGTLESMCVSGGIIYTAGRVSDGVKSIPCYWKGSTRVDLAVDGTNSAYARSICVNGDTVYTAGYYYNGIKDTSCYWRGSTRVDLAADGNNHAYAESVCVSGDTVYTAGYCTTGNDYINGHRIDIPCYWKGSIRVDLPVNGNKGGNVYSIYVSDGTVYTAGCYYDGSRNIPCYWKGSTRVDLAVDGTNSAYARSICVNGDTVYTAGYSYNGSKDIPCYWKGETRVDLMENVTYGGEVETIFIPLTCD